MKKVVFFLISLAFISCGKDSHLIDGKVSNSKGEVIEHVLVQVMGTDLNSKTNEEGEFRLNTRNRGDELIFTHPDYEMKRVDINEKTEFTIELTEKKALELQK